MERLLPAFTFSALLFSLFSNTDLTAALTFEAGMDPFFAGLNVLGFIRILPWLEIGG
jgi:hypothetical protein